MISHDLSTSRLWVQCPAGTSVPPWFFPQGKVFTNDGNASWSFQASCYICSCSDFIWMYWNLNYSTKQQHQPNEQKEMCSFRFLLVSSFSSMDNQKTHRKTQMPIQRIGMYHHDMRCTPVTWKKCYWTIRPFQLVKHRLWLEKKGIAHDIWHIWHIWPLCSFFGACLKWSECWVEQPAIPPNLEAAMPVRTSCPPVRLVKWKEILEPFDDLYFWRSGPPKTRPKFQSKPGSSKGSRYLNLIQNDDGSFSSFRMLQGRL